VKVTERRRRLRRLGRRPGDPRNQGEDSYNAAEVVGQGWASRGPTARAQEAKAVQEEKTWNVLGACTSIGIFQEYTLVVL
jgi:hypothetical protein